MKKTTYLILFLLFFSITSLVVHAQTPSDQNFGSYEDISYGPSVTYQLITYTGSDAYVGIGNTVGQGISLSPLFSGSAVVMGGNTSGGYVAFHSSSLSNNFRMVSFVADFYGHSNGNSSETYEIKGYDNGSEVVSVSNFIVTTSGSSGSGNAAIGWVREDYNDNGSNSGTMTFGSGWSNIDEIRFYPLDSAPNNNLFVGLDNIDFEPAVSPATAPTLTTTAASGVTATEATFGGNVTSDGGATVSSRGFVYSSSDNTPSIGEGGVSNVLDGSGTGVFSESISGLSASTTYYYQAYATNSKGTSYGGVESFTTSAPNIAPIVDANTGLTVTEGATGNIDSGKLHFNDDETGDDAQLTATITSTVAYGTLFLDANLNNTFDSGEDELLVNATFTQDDVNNDRLRYTNTVNDQTTDSFVFTLSDPDGGELTNQTFNITINQAPTVTVNNGLTLNEGTTELIDSGKLNSTDAETGSGSDITFTITSAVSHGILFVDSNPTTVFEAGDIELVVNTSFTMDDINNDRIRYTNNVADQNADSFEFKVSDPDGGELTDQTFTITINLLEVPTLTTTAASGVTNTTATLGGEVTDNGGATVTERGIVYNTTGTPNVDDDTKVQIGSGDGSFSDEITGLTAGTEYFVRAYAINSEGTSYGGVESFTTSNPQLENFSWSADNLSAGVTGVTFTFEYTTVTDLGGSDAILYALNTANGWNTNSVTVGDITVLVNGNSRTVAGIFSVGGSGAFITLDNPIVASGSEILVTIANVSNNGNPGTYNWNWIHTATGGGNEIDPAVSPDPIVLSANTAPTVTTSAASGVTNTTATLGGEVTDNGGATVTERGIVYNTTGTPNVDDDTKVQIGDGDGGFSGEITGLSAENQYFVRAYAINSEGTAYGSEESFTTSLNPSLTLSSSATDNTISSGASVTFTATPSGTSATNYLWKKNGIVVPGETNATYTTTDLVNGDVIEVQLSADSGTIVNSNLVLHLDAGDRSSYPGSGMAWTDISSNNNDATLPSNLATSYSTIAGAGSFNFQGNSSTTIQSSAVNNWDITSTNALSVETWVKRINGGHQFWFSTPNLHYRLGVDPSGNLFWDMGQYVDRNSGILVSEGVWHHIVYTAGVETGNITTRVYVDGEELADQNEGIATLSSITNYLIGDGQTPGQHPMNGNMGLLRVYNKTLSALEVAQNFNAEVDRFTTDVVSSNSITMTVHVPPTVTNTTASNITFSTAILGGEVTDNGEQTVTERGIVYNTTGTPNVDDDAKIIIGNGDGSFSDEITGLDSGTEYFVRAYAINVGGTGYGNEVSLTTTANDMPVGSLVADQSECINGSVTELALTITDTFPGDNTFAVTAASSNTSVVANADIIITGSGNTRSFAITPVLDAAGSSTITVTIEDSLGEIGTQTFNVTFNDLIPPTLTAVQNIEEELDANCNFVVPDYTSLTTVADNCGTTTITQSPIAGTVISGHGTLQTITLTADDGNGNTDSTSFDVTLVDATAPTLTSVGDTEEDLDANCNFTIPDYTGLTTAIDNCGTATVTQSPIAGTVISGHGTLQTITLTADDGNGNTDSTSFDVTLVDATAPTLTAVGDTEEELDASCNFTIPDYTGLTTAIDNCGTATVTQSPIAGTAISGHGTLQTITLTADDGNGNTDSTSFDVTLVDATAPTVVVQDVARQLNGTGSASVTAEEFVVESDDSCSNASISIDRTDFDCADLGDYTITITATDANGNTTTETATLTLTGEDTDGDLIADSCDNDKDNDGTPDEEDAFPLDGTEDTDTDGDGIGNNSDTDDDNDGTPDEEDAFPSDDTEDTDTDGDGIGNNSDTDDDNDGDSDEDELANNTDPLDDKSFFVPEEVDAPVISTLVPAQAFTPNGDGINDSWIVPGIENYPNALVKVYNRWGHEVFATKGYNNDWNASYKSNSDSLPSGSYMYVIDLANGMAPIQGWLFINY
jgi:gliding motility-associated-like protein